MEPSFTLHKNTCLNFLQVTAGDKYGVIDFGPGSSIETLATNRGMTRVLYLKSGSRLNIDLKEFVLVQDEVYFLRADQYLQFGEKCRGSLLFYNAELYCADLEDYDLVFGGVLFNSIPHNRSLKPDARLCETILSVFGAIKSELALADFNQDSMVRSLIKQLIVQSSRSWRQQHQSDIAGFSIRPDFGKIFVHLVEQNFRTYHAVAQYAKMLNITPKTLARKFIRYARQTPGEVIRNRIILEAKRMLVHTPLNVKEIGYRLGFEDPSYFIRFFTKQVNMAPQSFRKYIQSGLISVA